MTFYRVVNPDALGEPRGWNNGMLAPAGGRVLFVAGQVASDESGEVVVGLSFVAQFGVALERVLKVVEEAGGGPEHVGRLTIYVTDRKAYLSGLKELGVVYRAHMGRNYPAMSLVQVAGLVEPNALLEIEGTAVLPE
jgi:enamine deaminase RidA (YjgF/YER057c/UK114 family)